MELTFLAVPDLLFYALLEKPSGGGVIAAINHVIPKCIFSFGIFLSLGFLATFKQHLASP